ncbi:MAG: hypothetical protein LC715_06600 [Gammaproteobacteria bacterium]|nr:hypothetical protein [Gammaproteobacteria bacterium]
MPIRRLDPHIVAIDPRLDCGLRRLVLIGLTAVLLLPAARGYSVWLGWVPLWLLGMPLVGWWALHRFRLPRWPHPPFPAPGLRRRRPGIAQARRRGPAAARIGVARAA